MIASISGFLFALCSVSFLGDLFLPVGTWLWLKITRPRDTQVLVLGIYQGAMLAPCFGAKAPLPADGPGPSGPSPPTRSPACALEGHTHRQLGALDGLHELQGHLETRATGPTGVSKSRARFLRRQDHIDRMSQRTRRQRLRALGFGIRANPCNALRSSHFLSGLLRNCLPLKWSNPQK